MARLATRILFWGLEVLLLLVAGNALADNSMDDQRYADGKGPVLYDLSGPVALYSKQLKFKGVRELDGLSVADLDHDKLEEVILLSSSLGKLTIVKLPDLSQSSISVPKANLYRLSVGDLDGKGNKDAVLWQYQVTTKSFVVFLDLGGKSQQVNCELPEELTPGYVVLADVNADSLEEILTYDNRSGDWGQIQLSSDRVCSYTRWGNFASFGLQTVGAKDVNEDGRVDLLVQDRGFGSIAVLFSEEPSTFREVSVFHGDPTRAIVGAVFADLNDDEETDMLVRNPGTGEFIVSFSQSNPDFLYQPWAEFPAFGDWETAKHGDFNGDGRVDIVTRGKRGRYLWFGISLGDIAVEKKTSTEFKFSEKWSDIYVSDVDGDGISELIFLDDQSKSFWTSKLVFQRRLAGVTIGGLNFDWETKTAADGTYTLPKPQVNSGSSAATSATASLTSFPLSSLRLGPRSDQYRFFPNDRSFQRGELLKEATKEGVTASFGALPLASVAGERLLIAERKLAFDGPTLCTGFNPKSIAPWGRTSGFCPVSHVMLEVDDTSQSDYHDQIATYGICCQLPSRDILLDEHVLVESQCPAGFVVTGAKNDCDGCSTTGNCEQCRNLLRCTKLNQQRYLLANSRRGAYWGQGQSGWFGADIVNKGKIPPGLRHAVGRQGKTKWDADGCLGYPWGSLMVKREGTSCTEHYFSQLLYRGIMGDPPKNTPVKIFPDCFAVDDPSSAYARCLN